jgi:hypothetical protein
MATSRKAAGATMPDTTIPISGRDDPAAARQRVEDAVQVLIGDEWRRMALMALVDVYARSRTRAAMAEFASRAVE